VQYRETGDMRTSEGAGVGALIGGVLGILGGPAGMVIGAGVGAAIGAAAAQYDDGFKNESLKTVGNALKPGTSAVAAITNDNFLRAVHKQVSVEDTRQFVSNLAAEISARLAEGKNVALGLLLTESGLAFKEVAADKDSAQVIGLVVTNGAVVAGAAVATSGRVEYQVAAATEDGAVVEAGTVTKEGALIVDKIVDNEGETVVATAIVPDDAVEDGQTGEAGKSEDLPAAA
jgi:hypothetical protein